ncbi:MAG TPA: dephospho-CoA kinase [Saprospiraceae bacterium]|nr:dephospho-CoA kinase [Saprospiraceae bacterium]
MKIIGLTGGIGSGKSTVAAIFSTIGIPVYESDARAKALMNEDPDLKTKIKALLGSDAYKNGEINRAWIAERVFADKNLLEQLNAIVHPAVKKDAIAFAHEKANEAAPYIIKESAILLEENLTEELDAIILVVAPLGTRIERVMKRDGASREQIEERIRNQWTDDIKIPLADYVIFNDGERSLLEQVMDIDQMIKLM